MFRVKSTEYGPISERLLSANLSDLCVKKSGVQTGPFGSQLHREDYVEEGTPIITVEHLGDNRIVHENTPFVSDEDKERLSKYHLQEGDIVFSRVGSVDRRALVRKAEDGWLFSGRCLRVRVDTEKISPVYLSYFFGLESFKNYIRSIAVGATMPSLNTKLLSDVPVYYPESLAEQENIARLLYTLDDKIELNRQTNQTLEHIAQAIFKSWFVDFEPTRAKIIAKEQGANPATQELAAQAIICGAITLEQLAELEQNLATTLQQAIDEKLNQHNQTNPTALNAQQLKATAALFPNELVESELGDIPEGWETKPLYETAEYINGAAFKATDFSEDGSGLPIVKIAELKNGLGENTKYTTGNFNKRHFIQDEDVLYSWSGSPLTSLEVFKWFGGDGWLNQHIFKLNFNRVEEKYFTYYLLQHMKPVLIATAQQKQTTGLGHITVADMKRLLVAYPEDRVLSGFSEVIGSLYEKCSSLSKENISLTQLRDALLPKLLSGEIDVSALADNSEASA